MTVVGLCPVWPAIRHSVLTAVTNQCHSRFSPETISITCARNSGTTFQTTVAIYTRFTFCVIGALNIKKSLIATGMTDRNWINVGAGFLLFFRLFFWVCNR